MGYWRVNDRVRVRYRVIWNRVQLFGDYNTRVRVAHSCVIITKKLHSIPYDTITHSNEVINPYLHRQLTCSFSTFFPHERQWQVKTKVFSPRGFPTAYSLVPGVEHAENIVPRHSEKDSSKQIRFLCDYNFVDWCNFIINLYIQQQYIDSLSSKGWFIIISHQALLCFFSEMRQWARAACVFASQVSYYYAVCCRSIGWFYYAVDLWMKCSKWNHGNGARDNIADRADKVAISWNITRYFPFINIG